MLNVKLDPGHLLITAKGQLCINAPRTFYSTTCVVCRMKLKRETWTNCSTQQTTFLDESMVMRNVSKRLHWMFTFILLFVDAVIRYHKFSVKINENQISVPRNDYVNQL